MSIQHLYFQELKSTQDYLVENWKQLSLEGPAILIEAKHQTEGRGRFGRRWHSNNQHSLTVSFTLSPNPKWSLTAIEISCLIAKFLEIEFAQQVYLKWPNDLIFKKAKCGGILLQNLDAQTLACGVGLNISDEFSIVQAPQTEGDSFRLSTLDFLKNRPDLGLKLFEFILAHRLESESVLKEFKNRCVHLNKTCQIYANNTVTTGQFIGIGADGEAHLKNSGSLSSFYSGSLRY